MTMSPAARALLDAARDGLTPDAAALRRVRGKIGATAATAGASAVAMKLTIISVVALAVAGLALPDRTDATVPSLTFVTTAPVGEHAPQRAYEAPPPVAHIEMPEHRASPVDRARIEVAPHIEPVRVAPARTGPSRSGARRAVVSRAVVSRGDPSRVDPSRVDPSLPRGIDLAREVELVDAAMAALRQGDGAAALASVRLHRAETNNRGQLAEDAAAIEIEALCRLRDRRVGAKLEAFDARWPDSAQRSRLTTSCP